MIHLYYGFGKGKTSSAIGAGLRAFGAGKRVLFVQFLKDNKSSELKSIPFDIFSAPDSICFNPDNSYKPWVDSAIDYIKKSNADVIILDEFVDIIDKFISINDALELISGSHEYILTGHKKIDEIYQIADYVTAFNKEKHPYDKGIMAREGFEY